MESSLVAMSQNTSSIGTEEAAKKAEITATDLTNSYLHQHIIIIIIIIFTSDSAHPSRSPRFFVGLRLQG